MIRLEIAYFFSSCLIKNFSYLKEIPRSFSNGNSTSPPTLVFVDKSVPNPKLDSGSVRILEILRIVNELDLPVMTFALKQKKSNDSRGYLNYKDIKKILDTNAETNLHFWISRLTVANKVFRHLKNTYPNAKFIFDTVDLHGLRLLRNAAWLESKLWIYMARYVATRELSLIRAFDATVLVSEVELGHIPSELHNKVSVISNVHFSSASPQKTEWEFRRGQVFIGNFKHLPNAMGLDWYLREVWPLLDRNSREQGLTIIGAPIYKLPRGTIDKQYIKCLGFVDDADTLILAARVSIAPLITGAGVKGKIGQAMLLGIPIVTTSVGAEGMSLVDQMNAGISNDPTGFSERVHSFLWDQEKSKRVTDNASIIVRNRLSRGIAKKQLDLLFRKINA